LAEERTSRRHFIKTTGLVVVGAAAVPLLASCGSPGEEAPPAAPVTNGEPAAPVASNQPLQVPEWPWPYVKLDPEVVRKRGYDGYFKGGCCYGAASALLTTLVEEVGSPYDLIPMDMFRYGAAGGAGWGTLCGSLNGAAAVINMATKDFNPVISELFGWYTQFPFPSDKHEEYAKFKGQITTVSGSPLCHVSVTTWANAAGNKINADEKKDRCAKLTGDVAAKAVELLNAQLDGAFVAEYKPADDFAHCLGCHVGKDSMLDNVQGVMGCTSCHEPHDM